MHLAFIIHISFKGVAIFAINLAEVHAFIAIVDEVSIIDHTSIGICKGAVAVAFLILSLSFVN
jgi:hypothetical protein